MHLRLRHRLGLGRTLGSLPFSLVLAVNSSNPGERRPFTTSSHGKSQRIFHARTSPGYLFSYGDGDRRRFNSRPKTACQVMGGVN